MPTEDPIKADVSEQQSATTERIEPAELSDDDLKPVTGGIISGPGPGPDAIDCIS